MHVDALKLPLSSSHLQCTLLSFLSLWKPANLLQLLIERRNFLHRGRKCRKWCSVGLSCNFPADFKVKYLSHAICHVVSGTSLTPLFYNTVFLSSTVRVLKYSRIHESVIKYNVRKKVNPILFRLIPLLKVLFNLFELDILLIRIQSRLESRGVLPNMAYTERLHPKGAPFSGFKYMLGLGFHLWNIWKDRENGRFGW